MEKAKLELMPENENCDKERSEDNRTTNNHINRTVSYVFVLQNNDNIKYST